MPRDPAYKPYAGSRGMLAHYGGLISKVIDGRTVLPYLKKAEQMSPDAPAVLFGLGSYYMLVPKLFGRDIEKAKLYLEKTIVLDPYFADAYVRLAQIYKKLGDKTNYSSYLAKALDLDPGNELALDVLSGKCNFICLEDN